ncbi:hypothetical protein EDB81DRAFT_850325 [Dactylonectria macrodidyma]|uniref:Uncharacterized protein n=1 Tax=Dactylonectria macrodidyma TaxID=307937 RepID=A0A9P9FUD9_9HYPO|nr:hypothetical protein EDB81DRAFT_850325 [Dactylonectria macrodidyma]
MQELEGLQLFTIQNRFGNEGVLTSATTIQPCSSRHQIMLFQTRGPASLIKSMERMPFIITIYFATLWWMNGWTWHLTRDLLSCRVVPRQFFQPPLWLTNRNPGALAWDYANARFLKRFDQFLDVIRVVEREMYGNELLSDEWSRGKDGFLVANALESWTEIDVFSADFISWKWYRGKANVGECMKNLLEQDLTRRHQVSQLVQKRHEYKCELRKSRSGEARKESDDEVRAETSLQDTNTAFLGQAMSYHLRLCTNFPVRSTAIALAIVIIATATHFRMKQS